MGPIKFSALAGNQGSAIVLVVSIGAIVTLLVFTWIIFSVKRFHSVIDKQNELRARYAAESVVSQVIYDKVINPSDSLKKTDSLVVNANPDSTLIEDPLTYTDSLHKSSATAETKEEGSYFRVTAVGKSGTSECDIDALFGILLPDAYRFALMIFGSGSEVNPLDIKRGQIIGDIQSALQPKGYFTGKFDNSAAGKPAVDETKFNAEIALFEKKLQVGDSAENVLTTTQIYSDKTPPPVAKDTDLFVNGNVLIENRSSTPLVVKGPGAIVANGSIQISGRVVMDNVDIVATGNVQCFDFVRLRNAVIYSRQMIGFGDSTTFSGNLYAMTQFIMAGQAHTEMPTFAYVKGDSGKKAGKKDFSLQLTQHAHFSGSVFCKDPGSVSIIGRDARFTGLFYSTGHLILDGMVIGCVAAQSLVEKPEDLAKTNVLAGGTINRALLSNDFVVPCAFGQAGTTYKVVSWTMKHPPRNTKEGSE